MSNKQYKTETRGKRAANRVNPNDELKEILESSTAEAQDTEQVQDEPAVHQPVAREWNPADFALSAEVDAKVESTLTVTENKEPLFVEPVAFTGTVFQPFAALPQPGDSLTSMSVDQLKQFEVKPEMKILTVGDPITGFPGDLRIPEDAHMPSEVPDTSPPAAGEVSLEDQPAVEEPESKVQHADDLPLYQPQNLITMFMRHRANVSDEERTAMSLIMGAWTDSIEGPVTGFTSTLEKGKLTYKAKPSTLTHHYYERKGKRISKFFDAWQEDLANRGLNDGTTIDFFLVEPSRDGKTVLDAWLCTGIHPTEMTSIASSRSETLWAHVGFAVTFGGTIRRGNMQITAAQGLLDEMNLMIAGEQ